MSTPTWSEQQVERLIRGFVESLVAEAEGRQITKPPSESFESDETDEKGAGHA